MTTPPIVTPWGARLRERTEPLQPDDADHGYAHIHLSEGMAQALRRAAEIYDPEEGLPGSPLLDVDTCPDWALPWLAQISGVVLPPDTAPDDARYLIREVSGWKRGTPASMRAAAQLCLTGTKTVYFRERDPADDPPYQTYDEMVDAYAGQTYADLHTDYAAYSELARDIDAAYMLEVVTLESETPDPQCVEDALTAQKPAGIVLDYHTVSGWDYQAMTTAGGTYTALTAAYPTYFDLKEGPT